MEGCACMSAGVCGRLLDSTRGGVLCSGTCMAIKWCMEERKFVCRVMASAVRSVDGQSI